MHIPAVLQTLAALCACCATVAGCAAARHATPPVEARATEPSPSSPLDPHAAAARAVASSPRVAAAARRLDAATQRADATALPPDPSIALGFGIPIDGLGGTGLSFSVMQGIGWLVNGERLQSAAARERELASAELVAASVEVAAEARRLVRALAAARLRSAAAREAVVAGEAMSGIERAALAVGESSALRVARADEALADARLAAAFAETDERALNAAIASLLALAQPPTDLAADAAFEAIVPTESLAVLRARARLARAEANLAALDSTLGPSAAVGAGLSRDLEDREAFDGSLELTLPFFRRGHEVAALRAEVDAERAELAEAERLSSLELAQTTAAAEGARAALEIAEAAAGAAEIARTTLDRAHALGEASRADLADAAANAATARMRVAERRIALADAVARLESRSAAPRTAQGDMPAQAMDTRDRQPHAEGGVR